MSKMFERIETLPAEVVGFIKDAFNEGIDVETIGQQVQGLGHITDVAPANLAMLLKRYKRSLEAPDTPEEVAEDDDVDPVAELQRLAKLQKGRVATALDKEKSVGVALDANNKAISEYTATLTALQRAQIEQRKLKPRPLAERIEEAMALAKALQGR